MAETSANWDERSRGAGFDLTAARGQAHGEGATSHLPWGGDREIVAQQKSCLCFWAAEPALIAVNC